MQSTAVQIIDRKSTRESTSASASTSKRKDTVSTEFADPFLQIIMSMLSQAQVQTADTSQTQSSTNGILETNPIFTLLQNLQNDPDGVLEQTGENDSKDISNAVSLLSQILNGSLQLPEIDTGNHTILTQLMNSNSSSNAIGLVESSAADSSNSPELSNIIGMDSFLNLNNIAELSGIANQSGISDSSKPSELTTLSSIKNSAGDNANPLSTENSFPNAIVKVKELLSKTKTEAGNSDGEIDVDKLQNEMSQNKSVSAFELSLKAAGKTSESALSEQISTGIKQNLSLGKSEFTIKLKPETLGEITIKLVEDAGKTILSITTASAQTAKLINNDLAALREAVAPMHVQVNEAVIHTNGTSEGTMQQFNMSGQQFTGQQFAGQQFAGQQFAGQQGYVSTYDSKYGSSDDNYSEDIIDGVQTMTKQTASEKLDAYI